VGGLIAGLLLSLRFHMARQYRDGMRGLNRARRRARAARISLTFRRRRLARAAARQDGIERQVVGLVEAGRQRWLRLVDLVRVEMTESALEHDHDPFVMIVPEPEPTDDVVDTLLNPERPAATQPVVVPTVVEPAPVDDPADDPRPDGMGADDERTEADDDPAQSEAWAPPPPPPPPPHAAPPPPPRPPAEVAGLTVTDGDPLSEAELDEMPTAAWARPRDRVTVNGGPPPDIPRDRPRDRSAQGGPQ
jgi:hypothetical protein